MTAEQEFFEAFNLSPVICTSNFHEPFIGSMDELIKSSSTCDRSWIRDNRNRN